jgi:hypothetical protein
MALTALCHRRVHWTGGGDSKFFHRILHYGIQCSNKTTVKLSYRHRHEREGRRLQLLRFPPLDHTMNQQCYISVTARILLCRAHQFWH